MATRGSSDAHADAASYESSSSASSDDAVLITKQHRKKLQQHQQQQQQSSRESTKSTTEKAAPPVPTAKSPTTTAAGSAKPDHMCGVCEREGGDLVVCTGSCVSAFHVACLSLSTDDVVTARDAWKCPSCATGRHVCFHCKQRGLVATNDTGDGSASTAAGEDTTDTNSTTAGMRAVVKCRALSCGKYYHQDCIAKLPLARIAGSRFICPLHTCAACEQSGAKKEPVRCTRCPVAYHTSCLPRSGVVALPGKRIICPKHDGTLPPQAEEEQAAKAEAAEAEEAEEGEVQEGEEEGEVEEGEEKEVPVSGMAMVKAVPAVSRVVTTTDDHDTALSVAASSPRTEENDDDARSETSATGGTGASKKKDKKDKKDKKKKKKKRKKEKEKKKERSGKPSGDGETSEKEDAAKKSEKKQSSKSSSSVTKVERRSEDEAGNDDDENRVKTASTASEDDRDEARAAALDLVPVKKENEAVSLPAPERDEPVVSTAVQDAVSTEAAVDSDRVQADVDAVLAKDTPDRVKAEHHGQEMEDVDTGHSPSKRGPEEVVRPRETLEHRDEHHANSIEVGETDEAPEAMESPAKSERTDRHDEQRTDEKHEHLTVKIPEVAMSGMGGDGEDGELDDDSGSGSGSQSVKARNSSRSVPEDVVKEKSGGSSRSKKSKKKRKGGKAEDASKQRGPEDHEDMGEGQQKDEAKWVQCDDCKKWRTVAKEIDLDSMPETWYCKMNTWNKAFASCDVPEEVVETKKSKSSKRSMSAIGDVATPVPKKTKLTKQVSAPEPPSAGDAEGGAAEKDKNAAGKVVKKADKDSKKRKLKLKLREKYGEVNWVQCENKQCGKWRVVPSSANALPSAWYCNLNTWAPELASCSAANPPDVEAYLSKSQSKKPSSTRPAKRQRGPDQDAGAATATVNHVEIIQKPAAIKPSKNSAKSSTPTAHVVGAASAAAGGLGGTTGVASQNAAEDGRGAKVALPGVKSVVLEWAQCEKCLKWRKLPAHIKSSTLPDKWYCSMNHWDPSRASCALPQEEDQEPVDASPLPSSQNWYPMPGQVGGSSSTGGASVRSKRGKLSYSELLYASTGQLRKTYTSDSSTLSFEYEGVMYHRDDQYKRSCMYVSPLTTNKITGEQIDPQAEALKVRDTAFQLAAPAMQRLIDEISKVILSKIDLRREFAITEIVDGVLTDSEVGCSSDLSLNAITSAIAQLVAMGELEKVDRSSSRSQQQQHEADVVTSTSRASAMSILLGSLSSQPAYYRKVPKRPLKALKMWKLAAS